MKNQTNEEPKKELKEDPTKESKKILIGKMIIVAMENNKWKTAYELSKLEHDATVQNHQALRLAIRNNSDARLIENLVKNGADLRANDDELLILAPKYLDCSTTVLLCSWI